MIIDLISGVGLVPSDGRIFVVSGLAVVVDGGSFVEAAELSGFTDSDVSRAIRRLARVGAAARSHHAIGHRITAHTLEPVLDRSNLRVAEGVGIGAKARGKKRHRGHTRNPASTEYKNGGSQPPSFVRESDLGTNELMGSRCGYPRDPSPRQADHDW
jgi:hypothetical protein